MNNIDRQTGSIPKDLSCPLSGKIMEDPVVAQDGISYERANIEQWLTKEKTSPTTKEEMGPVLVANRNLADYISDYNKKNQLQILIDN